MSHIKLQAQFDFVARVANELSFKEGDIITLIEKHESGMWKGELDGKIGLFPYNFVIELPPEGAGAGAASVQSDKPMEGWLTKQGHLVKNWKRRWFVLKGSTLSYFENQTSSKEKGSVILTGCDVSNGEDKCGKPFSFHISFPGKPKEKEFFVFADDVNQMNQWVAAIVEASKL